jgi:YidC/Oxa1 family membrane protein insertase
MGTTFMAPLAMGLLWALNLIYGVIPNYGVAIVLLTVLIKLILFPLDRRSARSMKEMQKIQPLIKQLQAKHKDDKRQLQIEQMKLFKEHKVNPLGGCFPILLQFPILYGMFTMLRNAVELWRAPFFGYINDLSKPDTLFSIPSFPLLGHLDVHVLPILMTVFTLLSQRLRGQGQTTDPQQKMMANMMPIIFLVIFWSFPSGLNLYWLCSTVFTFGVQLIVQKSDDQHLPAKENQTHGNARKR